MYRCLVISFLVLCASVSGTLNAQELFRYVGALRNFHIIGNNVVTVSSANGTPIFYQNACGVGPYTIGDPGGFWGAIPPSPLSYTFSFSRAVSYVRVQLSLIRKPGQVIAFEVNGVYYPLTRDNFKPYLAPSTCPQDTATVDFGNVAYPVGFTSNTGAEINIHVPSGIWSVKVASVGIQTGCAFNFLFSQIFANNNGALCPGDTLRLLSEPSVENAHYSWTGPNGFISNLQNPVIPDVTNSHDGVYTLTISTDKDTLSDTTYVQVYPLPPIPEVSVDMPVCVGSTLRLHANSPIPGDFRWSGPYRFSDTTADPVKEDVNDNDTGVYKVFLTDVNGCASDSAAITIDVLHPVAYSFTKVVCDNEGYMFNGEVITTPGRYKITQPGSNGCDSVTNLNLVHIPAPEAGVGTNIDRELCIGDTIMLTGRGGIKYLWYDAAGVPFGTGEIIPVTLLDLTNRALVVATARNECKDTSEITIAAKSCCQMSIPSAFSPNGDGRNDMFGALMFGYSDVNQMEIYNRWGQLVYAGSGPDNKWDGTVKNEPASADTYHYLIKGTCFERGGREIVRRGSVVLVR